MTKTFLLGSESLKLNMLGTGTSKASMKKNAGIFISSL